MSIPDVLARAQAHPQCTFLPTDSHIIVRREDERVPDDAAQFYALCGGAVLFAGSPGELTILRPDEVIPANPVIVGDPGDDDEVSRSTYLIARTSTGDLLSIDLSMLRNGRIYDSFHEVHGVVGSWPVIAPSFAAFLEQVWAGQGSLAYWLPEAGPPGRAFPDAYDEVDIV
ncbi:Antitoxin YokJ [Microbacterium sp. MM2322]|uniref:hypothetical protein n=1 Tax=Microbacterium sp. MM2322 TaxID=3157631 RepID=UPI003D804FFF